MPSAPGQSPTRARHPYVVCVEIHKPEPVGDQGVIRKLQKVVFIGIEGAVGVSPRGLTRVRVARMLGGFMTIAAAVLPLLTIHATDPLPATSIYLVVTTEDMRLYAAETTPYEIGRWPKHTYRASVSAEGRSLDLEVDRLGVIHLNAVRRSGPTSAVFDLVVRYAAGPVMPV